MEKNAKNLNFDDIYNEKAKECAEKLYNYCKCMKNAYDLQFQFPEYFDPSQPTWFTSLISLTKKNEKAIIQYIIAINSVKKIIEVKKQFMKDGKKFGAIVRALNLGNIEVNDALLVKEKTSEKLRKFLLNITEKRQRKLQYFDNSYRAKELGLETSRTNYKNYIVNTQGLNSDNNNEKDEKEIELKNALAEAIMAFKETNLMRLSFIKTMETDQNLSEFNKNFDLTPLHKYAHDLGLIRGELLCVNETWQDFLRKIGGLQYIMDVKGDDKKFFKLNRKEVKRILSIQKNMNSELNLGFTTLFESACDSEEDARRRLLIPDWDDPVEEEVVAEEEQDKLCAFQAGKCYQP